MSWLSYSLSFIISSFPLSLNLKDKVRTTQRSRSKCLLHVTCAFQASSQSPLHQKEYFRMLGTSSLTFSFPKEYQIFFFSFRAPFFLWILLVLLFCIVFHGYSTLLWYRSKMKLSVHIFLMLNNLAGVYILTNIGLVLSGSGL